MPIIYRAMSEAEFISTRKKGRPDFYRRYKWFSDDLDHVRQRVQDGQFNNGKDYSYLCAFKVESLDRMRMVGRNELMADRRHNQRIVFVGVVE